MSFTWDAKNNFILLYFVTRYQQQSLSSEINWLSIVNDMSLEISSTPDLLKTQYENLRETFDLKQDSKPLYSTLKHLYLHSLCQKIEDNVTLTLETVYELIRHVRTKRINDNDIEQLIKEWNFNYSSDDEKKNKERLFDILNRLRDYIHTLPNSDYRPIHYSLSDHSIINQPSTTQKEIQDDGLELVSDSDEEMSTINKPNELINTNEQEKPPYTRRRTQSLTIFTENKDNKVNIGVEWFVPKLKRQQRSSSLHSRSQSPLPIEPLSTQNQTVQSNGILMTTIDNDESSESTNIRQTHTQPTISWLPLTNEQVHEKEHQTTELKYLDDQRLDPVSSDSDSIEVQWIPSSDPSHHQTTSSSSHDLDQNQQEQNSCKRQRLS